MTTATLFAIQARYRDALACFEKLQLAAAGNIACAALEDASGYPWPTQSMLKTPPHFDANTALPLLTNTLSLLARQNLVAFATGGTLLGLAREGRLLPGDKDLDIAAPIAYFERVATALAELGWQPAWIPLRASNFKSFVHPASGITLDLVGTDFDPVRGKVVGGWWPEGMPQEAGRLLAFSPFPLELRSVGESGEWRHWVIPQPDTLLTEMFGPTWRIPDPDWVGLFETPALVEHTQFSHVLGYLRLLEAWLSGRQQRFQRLAAALRRLDPADPGLRCLPQVLAAKVGASETAKAARHTAEDVTAGLRQSLQHFTNNRIPPALATARQALQFAASLPLPKPLPSPVTPIDTTVALPLLQQTLAALASQGIQAFAFAGVLLGLVREGRLLPKDKDLDVVVPWPQFAAAGRQLLASGWQPARTTVQADNFRCFIHSPSGITLDLFGYDFQPESVYGGWWPTGLAREEGRLLRFSPFELQPVASPCGNHWAIAQPEPVLMELYGPGWRVPDRDFDTTLETPALVANTDYTRCWGLLRLLEAWTYGRHAACLRHLNTLARRDPDDALLADLRHRLETEKETAEATPC